MQSHIRLSELNQKISAAIVRSLGYQTWWVVADVTSHSFREEKSYHSFELVEKDPSSNRIFARIQAKAWGDGSTRVAQFERATGQKFTSNIQVLVHLSVEYHPVYGLQANVLDVDPNYTLGAIEQQRLATLDRLVRENPDFITRVNERFVTKNNQLPLPIVIQRVAIISSRTSAGAEDFKHTLETNPFGYRFDIDHYHTAVQGENNADQFVSTIIGVFNSGKSHDVVVIVRGGGAQMDLLLFDDYRVGRAIARYPVPVITGIGHQKNETIADLMAHTAVKTPTKAAEMIVAHNRNFEESMVGLQQHIVIQSQQLFFANRHRLSSIQSVIINCSRDIISHHKERLAAGRQRLINSSKNVVKHHRTSIDHFASLLKAVHPDNILKRGFALVRSGEKIIAKGGDIEKGSEIEIVFSDSRVHATVNNKKDRDGSEFNI